MTNRERYKQAFAALPSSRQINLEAEKMEQIRRTHRKKIAAAAAIACAAVIGVGGTAYAADLGGIQTRISIWLFGKQTEVVATENEGGGYTFTYDRGDGTEGISAFGGISIDEDGGQTWLTAEELAEHINDSASVEKDEDGKIWVYYYDQKKEITDLFDENGVCSVSITHEDKTVYLTIIENGAGSYSYTQTNDRAEAEADAAEYSTMTTTIITDEN